jgi:hypothetical protein
MMRHLQGPSAVRLALPTLGTLPPQLVNSIHELCYGAKCPDVSNNDTNYPCERCEEMLSQNQSDEAREARRRRTHVPAGPCATSITCRSLPTVITIVYVFCPPG